VICRYQAQRHLSGQMPSVELATVGRRVCETEWDLLNLLEDTHPGPRIAQVSAVGGSSPGWHGRPTATELIGAVADFLDGDVREATQGRVNFHTRVAANALRMVIRELQAGDPSAVSAALAALGADDEAGLAASIRRGDLDDRGDDVSRCLRALVGHRLAAAHPGYDEE
jgi:hypothetical protein